MTYGNKNLSHKEKLICIDANKFFRLYDYYVQREKIATRVRTLHYVKPRHIKKAYEIFKPQHSVVYPMVMLPTDEYKLSEDWNPREYENKDKSI